MSNVTTMPPGPPLLPPPYTDATRAPVLIGSVAGLLSLTLIIVVLRVYVRAVVLRKWGADDTLAVISFILTLNLGILFAICTRYGLGRHIWTIPPDQEPPGRRILLAATIGYHASYVVIKMTFLVQYRRVFEVPWFRVICDVILTFIIMFGIAVIVSSVIIAIPSWNGNMAAAAKYDNGQWWLATSVVHLVTDIIIFLMPIPLLRRLNLRKTLKAALMVIFGIGFVTTAISVIRITTLGPGFTLDFTWDIIPALIWSQAEVCCAILCACISTLSPILRLRKDGRGGWRGQMSDASDNVPITHAPEKLGAFSSPSMPSPGPVNIRPQTQFRGPPAPQFCYNDVSILNASQILATAHSDDGSEVFVRADEEIGIATPLSPPPKFSSRTTAMGATRETPRSTTEGGKREKQDNLSTSWRPERSEEVKKMLPRASRGGEEELSKKTHYNVSND